MLAVYYLFPLYVMIMTSLKPLAEIRASNIFLPPRDWTFDAWFKAWDDACTGLYCEGLKAGFWNSVKIAIPSVIISIIIAAAPTAIVLANWKFKGSELIFTILLFGAFIPYQVLIYPIVIILRSMQLFGTLPGIIIVHTIFGMPILTLLFRNYFASLPRRTVQVGARRRRRVLAHSSAGHGADVAADLRRGADPAGHRHLERLPVRRHLCRTSKTCR